MPETGPRQEDVVADTLRTAQREIIPTVQEMLASTRDHKLTPEQIQELTSRFHLERENIDLLNQSAIAQTALETQVQLEGVKENVEKSNWLKQKYPEFAGLIDAFPDRLDEWEKRIELSLAVKATEEKGYFIGAENKKDFEEVLHQLATNPDTSYFQNTRMSTNVTGAGRLSYSLEQNYTLVEFLLRVSNQTSTVVDLFGGPKIETSPEEQEKIQRLKTFMASFEGVLDDTDYREEFVKMYQSLNAGDLEGALKTMEKFVHEDYDISLRDVVGSDHSLFDALRSIGDTQKAGEIGLTTIQQSALKDTNNPLGAVITSSMEAKKQEKTTEATKKYDTILASLEGHPMYYEFERNKNAHIQEIGNILALTDIVDGYIKEHGTEDLGLLGDWYDDMKGLSGFFNFSDENAKMTKETGIMLASFVATAGVGAFFSIVATGARGVQVASMTARVARTGGFINGVKNVGSLTVAGVALTGAKIFETGATGINLIKGIGFVGDTLIFTTAESMLKLMTQVPGDRQQSLLSFGEHLIKNGAMFGLFAGAGKLTEGLIAKYPQLLGSIQFARFGTLASGDLSAMYVLHCIETGELTMTPEDWAMLGAQVVGFRGLMHGIDMMYPKVLKRIQEHGKGNTQKLSSEVSMSKAEKAQIQKRVENISHRIEPIEDRAIVATPAYITEDLRPLVDSLLAQDGKFHSVIYINAPKGVATLQELDEKIALLKQYIESKSPGVGKTFSVTGNLYEARATIGTVRADMLDAIRLKVNTSIKDPIIVGLDADTYQLGNRYIEGVIERFSTDENITYLRGQLRWTHPETGGIVHLSERLMQSGYTPFHEQNSGWVASSGGSTSYRLDAYTQAGGYDRSAKVIEDVLLGRELILQGEGQVYGGKVHVSPRRGEQSIQEGRRFQDQWDDGFSPVNEATLDRNVYKRMDDITMKFKQGGNLSTDEATALIDVINAHIQGNGYSLNKFKKFWNITAKNSNYKVQVEGDKITLVDSSGTVLRGTDSAQPVSGPAGNPVSKPTGNPISNPVSGPAGNPISNPVSSPAGSGGQASPNSLSKVAVGGIGLGVLGALGYYEYLHSEESKGTSPLPLVGGEPPDRVSETPNPTTGGEGPEGRSETPTTGNEPPARRRETSTTGSEHLHLPDAIAYNKRYTKNQMKLIQGKLGVTDDGIVGTTTVNATIDFQKKNGLVPDGKAGPLTLGKMIGSKGKGREIVAEGEKGKFARVSHTSSTHRQGDPIPSSTVPREDAGENQHEERNPEPEVVSENPDRERIYEELKQGLKELKVRFNEIGSFRLDIDMAGLGDKSEVYIDEKAQIFFSSSKIKNGDGKIIPFQASTSGDTLYYLNVINQIVRKRDDLARAQRDANAESSFDFSPHQKVNHIEAELDALYRDLGI